MFEFDANFNWAVGATVIPPLTFKSWLAKKFTMAVPETEIEHASIEDEEV